MLELAASASVFAADADTVFWVGVGLTGLASTLIILSELDYMRNILAGRAHPNPVAWLGWAIGAVLVLYGAIAESTGFNLSAFGELLAQAYVLEKDAVATLATLVYMTVLLVCTGLIAWLAATVGEGKKHVGLREGLSIIVFTVCALALAADFAGFLEVPWWGPWAAFACGILIDFSAWYPLYRGVVERPRDEIAQLWPWRLTVWSAGINLLALIPNTLAAGTILLTALIFAVYYFVVNALVLLSLEKYKEQQTLSVPAE